MVAKYIEFIAVETRRVLARAQAGFLDEHTVAQALRFADFIAVAGKAQQQLAGDGAIGALTELCLHGPFLRFDDMR